LLVVGACAADDLTHPSTYKAATLPVPSQTEQIEQSLAVALGMLLACRANALRLHLESYPKCGSVVDDDDDDDDDSCGGGGGSVVVAAAAADDDDGDDGHDGHDDDDDDDDDDDNA
jgi:hypothetical protein